MSDAYSVVKTIVLSEKSAQQMDAENKYTFKVAKTANKIEIAKAVASIFDVKVEAVNTANYSGKKKRARTAVAGRTASYKKAVVTLAAESSIDIF